METENKLLNYKGHVIRANKTNKGLIKELDLLCASDENRYYLQRTNKDIRVLKRGGKYFICDASV